MQLFYVVRKKVLLELIEPVLTITLSSVVDVLAHDLVFYKLFCSLLQVIGWSMWFAEYLFLERSWAKDEKTLKVILHLSCTRHPTFSFSHIELFIFGIQWGLQRLKDFPRPFWLALFVEGTRFTPAKLLAVQEYVASQGLPAPRNVLIPCTNSPHPRFTCCGCSVELRAPATNSPLLDPFFPRSIWEASRSKDSLQTHADRHAGRARRAQTAAACG